MLYKFKIIIVLFLAIGLFSCSNDFEIAAEWKDIPVVFGFLSPSDTAQYIRVERAYLDPDNNAYTIGQNPDSIYYDNIEVRIFNVSTNEEYNLEKVDGALEGYPKDDGIFNSEHNWLYKIHSNDINLTVNDNYNLEVIRDDKILTSSSTKLVEEYTFRSTTPDSLNMTSYNSNFRFEWSKGSQSAYYFTFVLKFNYIENGTDLKEVIWIPKTTILAEESLSGSYYKIKFKGRSFYEFLAGSIPIDVGVTREFSHIDVFLWAGTKDIFDYNNSNLINSGLTGAQIFKNFTNIENGVGIFSSRSVVEKLNITLTNRTLDTLSYGVYTKDLNFIH